VTPRPKPRRDDDAHRAVAPGFPGRQQQASAESGKHWQASLSNNGVRLAPIALFVYARPDHALQALEALRANDLAQQSDLFVFADGAKSDSDIAGVLAVRKLIRSIDGFKSVVIIERERNLGLSKSVVSGVAQLCDEFGRVIAIEDDVITAPDFLKFMNRGLQQYANEPKALSICAFNPPIVIPRDYSYDSFWSYRFACWGWATWKDRWDKADWSVQDYPEFRSNLQKQKQFNLGGDDLSWLLTLHMEGKIDSWDTVWAYTHCKHGGLALIPVASKAYNIGLDGSGTHCKRAPFEQNILEPGDASEYRFPNSVIVDPYFVAEIRRFHHPSMARRFVRFVKRLGPRKKRFDTVNVVNGQA
jgi:hypothetical protein